MDLQFEGGAKGDPRFDDLVELIEYGQSSLLILTQDEGFQNLRICFFAPAKKIRWDLPFDSFVETLEFAKKDLYSYRNESEMESATVKNPYSPMLKFDLQKNSARISCKSHLFAEILKDSSDKIRLWIYPNSNEKNEYNVIHWDILFQEFIEVVSEAKNAMLRGDIINEIDSDK